MPRDSKKPAPDRRPLLFAGLVGLCLLVVLGYTLRALTLAPANAYLLKEELVARATEENPEVLATVKTLREQIAPIVELVRMHARSDVDEMARQLLLSAKSHGFPPDLEGRGMP